EDLPGPRGGAVGKILVDVPGLRRITAVVAHDDEDGRPVLLSEAEGRRHWVVMERAVTNDAHDGVAGPGQLDAERRAQAGTKCAVPAAVLPEGLGLEKELPHLRDLGHDLIDDARGRGEGAVERAEEGGRRHRPLDLSQRSVGVLYALG